MGTARSHAALAVGFAFVALGCSAVTQQLLIGEWQCAGATEHSVNSLTIYSWGTGPGGEVCAKTG